MSSVYAYKFKDGNGVDQWLYLPVFTSYKTGLRGEFTSIQAFDTAYDLAYDYLTTHFAQTDSGKALAVSFGFENVYSVQSLDGEIWTMANDNTKEIRFDASGQGSGKVLQFYVNNVNVGNWSFSTTAYETMKSLSSLESLNNNYYASEFAMQGSQGGFWVWNSAYPSQVSAPAQWFIDFFDTPYVSPSDPYAPEGPAETGGGGGTFDITSDSNPIPSDPAISATDTGFMTVFATNLAGIQSLSTSLWADIFPATLSGGALEETVQALKNIVASPYDAILGCHIVPVTVPVGSSKNVKLYGVLPSSVSLPVASTQWVTKDCGTLQIQLIDASYLDYAPYTKVTSLYLPFIGVVSIDIDIIMGRTLGVVYKIDIVSGQCIAFITVDGDVKFQYQGQCAVPLPVTSVDWSTTVSAGLGIVGSVTSIVGSAVGGALGGGAAGALAGAVKGTIGEAGSIAQNVMNSKPDIKAGGGIGGSAALMGCKYPYLIMERPKKSTPIIDDLAQNHWTGYPSNIAARLGDLEGYTEVSRVFVNRTTATAEEKSEIERLLNEGVYI